MTEKEILDYLNSCLLFFLMDNELKESALHQHLYGAVESSQAV